MTTDMDRWLRAVNWNEAGLVPVIAHEVGSGRVLMLAWMNQEALLETVKRGEAVYWSRSRGRLWRKGETSGNVQEVRAIYLDCDGDTVLLDVEQHGGIACHTGRRSCFYRRLETGRWQTVDAPLKQPSEMYQHE